jgi:glycerol-3-phosphate acyltransferase PlsY
MSVVQQLLLLIGVAYVAGSVPFGLIVGLSRGIDPRKAGSGNIGATNVGRLLGGKYFALVFSLDLLKGMLPALAASWVVGHRQGGGDADGAEVYLLWLLVAFAAVVGHMFSLFLKFKGGKGVATSAGVMLGIFPDYTLAACVVLLVFGIVLTTTRIVSLASMLGSSSFPFAYVGICLLRGQAMLGQRWPMLVFAVLVAAMIDFKHRGNIRRIRAGTEPRLKSRTSEPAPPPPPPP